MTPEEFRYLYANNPQFKAAVDGYYANQARLQPPTPGQRAAGFLQNRVQNSLLKRGYNALTGGGLASSAAANTAFNSAAGLASQGAYNAPAVASSLDSALANAFSGGGPVGIDSVTGLASNSLPVASAGGVGPGAAISSHAGPAVAAFVAAKTLEGLRKAGQGESRLGHKDWGGLARRGFQIPAGVLKQKVGSNNAAFTASRNESDLTPQDINETAAPRLLFPDWDTGFTQDQQLGILQQAKDLGLVRERNGGLRLEAVGTGRGNKGSKKKEFKQLWDIVQGYRRANSENPELKPLNPEEAFAPQLTFIKDRATGKLSSVATDPFGRNVSKAIRNGKVVKTSGEDLVSYNIFDVEGGRPVERATATGEGENARSLSDYYKTFGPGGSVRSEKQQEAIRRALLLRNQLAGKK